MSNREIFKKAYEAHLSFQEELDKLFLVGFFCDESRLVGSFHEILELVMSQVLTEEGDTYFYENVLFKIDSSEEAAEILEPYFADQLVLR